jgi:hypothetical protein
MRVREIDITIIDLCLVRYKNLLSSELRRYRKYELIFYSFFEERFRAADIGVNDSDRGT